MSRIADALPLPTVYYERTKKDFYVPKEDGSWLPLNETGTKRYLRSEGYSADRVQGSELSDCDRYLLRVQMENDVAYAAPLAGYDAGPYVINGQRILVTESPKLVEPVEGKWPLLAGILDGMFNDPIHDQRPYLYGWLKVALDALRQKRWQPGQALALAGPVQSAKSLVQNLVTILLGGRSAKPYAFMSGTTAFNSDFFRSEHLMIEDVAESIRIEKRRHFGAQVKAFSVNREQHCHGKHMAGLTLTPFWRVTISLNDDPERLLVLPPLDEDIQDKIILLKAHKKEMPMPTDSADQKAIFWNALLKELPAFVHFLREWEIPETLRSARFGITHYHHPELTEGLRSLAPEEQLVELIDLEVFHPAVNRREWRGYAAELHQQLTRLESRCTKQAQSLLHGPTASGTYLQRLTKRYPDRFKSRMIDGRSLYSIGPPPPHPD